MTDEKKTGTLRFRGAPERGRWYLDFKDGDPWIPCADANGIPLFTRKDDRPSVETWRAKYLATMERLGAIRETALTVSKWYDAYYKAAAKGEVGKKNQGQPQASVDDRRARFVKWIEPHIGSILMRDVTAEHLRKIVRILDEQIRIRLAYYREHPDAVTRIGKKPGIGDAANMWGEVTSGFDEAKNSKLDELRVLTVNPADGVRGPTTARTREQAALFPSDVITLLSCEDIPAPARVTYALAIYTGMRLGELRLLTVAHVDVEHGVINVPGTKNENAKRQVPIEASLLPLLTSLLKVRKGENIQVPEADGRGGASDLMKKDLRIADLTRPDLTRDDAEHMPFTFHGLRHTAVTHWAVAGKPLTWLLAVAGHSDAEMTQRYCNAAAVVRPTFGQPHPPIPSALVESIPIDMVTGKVTKATRLTKKALDTGTLQRSQRELKQHEMPIFQADRALEGDRSEHLSSVRSNSVAKRSSPDLARLAALARIVETLSSGDVKVLASELREALEALADVGGGTVVNMLARRR